MNKVFISEPSMILKKRLNEFVDATIEDKNDFNYIQFDFEENSLEEIIQCLLTPAFGSDKKIVICKNPYFFKDEKIKLPFSNDLSEIEKYLKDPNPDCEWVIVCPAKYYSNKNKYMNLFHKYGEVVNLLFENDDELYDYFNQLIAVSKINITEKGKQLLFQRCLKDVCKLEREIAKLVLYNDAIDEQLIDKMVNKPLEDDVFELSNALLLKDHKRIMRIYTDLKTLKIEPIYLISLLANQFRLMIQTAILRKKNNSEAQIATLLGVHPYRIKLACKYLANYPLKDVKQILIDLADLDAKIKSGEYDRYIDFELFLATK